MAATAFDLLRFAKEPVLGIVRGVTVESLQGLMNAIVSGGLQFVEITLNTPNALELIEKSAKEYSASLCLGAGTVLSVEQARSAVSCGARFLVSPTLNEAVAAYCKQSDIAYFPGALTPSEIEKAWNAGAAMVKVFPAAQMGADYFRQIKGPFESIRLLAVGGIGPNNIYEYLSAGASGLALGGSIISPARMRDKEFSIIQKEIKDFLLAVRNFYSNIT